MKVIKAMTIMHEIKKINILYTQSVLADFLNHLYPAELSVPLITSLIIMSLFHVCIYKVDLVLHMLPEAHKNRCLQSTMQVLVHFCGTGNFFFMMQNRCRHHSKGSFFVKDKTKQAYRFNYI